MLRRHSSRRPFAARVLLAAAVPCLAALLAGGPAATPAAAMKLYRDTATGAVYSTPGEGRTEYKPFGLDIGFQFFLQYDLELEDRNQPAAAPYALKNTTTSPYDNFSATRTIVDIRRAFSKNFRTRLVLDTRGTSQPAAGHSYNVYVRHVYGEFDAPSLVSTFTFGEIGLPLVPYNDGFWGFRVQGTDFLEREGLLTSADWGLGWSYNPPQVPIVWHSTFTNGEGRTTPEMNSGKSFESRLTWTTPVDGLTLTGGLNYATGGNEAGPAAGAINTGVNVRQIRWVGQALFKQPSWRIGATYAWAEDEANTYANAALLLSNSSANMNRQSVPATGYAINAIKGHGWSLMGAAAVPSTKWTILGRFDWYDPAHHVPDNEHTRVILGPAYKVNDWMTLVATYEALDFEAGAEAASGANTTNAFDQSRLLVQAEIKF